MACLENYWIFSEFIHVLNILSRHRTGMKLYQDAQNTAVILSGACQRKNGLTVL